VWRLTTIRSPFAQCRPLDDTEPVLFIDYGQAEAGKRHGLLDQSVRPNDDVNLTGGDGACHAALHGWRQ
jgi:hypothetical protein